MGFIYLIKGFKYLTTKGVRRYILMPILINLILFSFALGVGIHYINLSTHLLPHWLHWLKWVFDIFFVLVSSVILAYIFTIVCNLIGAPFNSLLSEKVEIMLSGKKPSLDDGIKAAIKDIPRTVKREWHKITYYLPRALLLLILYFIPIINVAAGVIWFLFSSWMMAIQYLDYPLDNHKTTFDEMKAHLKQRPLENCSFGFAVMIASMIPIINFIVMPAAVIGATMMYIEQAASK